MGTEYKTNEVKATGQSGGLLRAMLDYHTDSVSLAPVDNRIGNGKQPMVPWKRYQQQRPTLATVKRWAGLPNLTGVAAVLGRVSGDLAARDFDVADAYCRWAQDHPVLSQTCPVSRTARGFHVYFRRQNTPTHHYEDGELRGEGSYILLPPSISAGGHQYEWIVPWRVDLPHIEDLAAAGLVPANFRQSTYESAGERRRTEEVRLRNEEVSGGPIEDRTRWAATASVAVPVSAIISQTLPKRTGQRHHCIFDLIRHLRGMPEYQDASADAAEHILHQWHTQALPIIATKDWETSWMDFIDGWDRVRVPKGMGLMDVMKQQIDEAQLPPKAQKYENPKLRTLAGLCQQLAQRSSDGVFFLSTRTAAEAVPLEGPRTAWMFMRLLEHDRIIECVEKGTLKGGKKASRYRWIANTKTKEKTP